MEDSIEIFMCGNSGVEDGMMLCAISIAKHCSRPVTLYIGTMDLSELDPRFTPVSAECADEIREILRGANRASDVRVVDLGDHFRCELMDSPNLGTSYTPYTMIRLFADLIPEMGDKLLYLDCDVLLSGDIGELYDIDVDGYHLAGVPDYYGRIFIYPRYLNGGVMLWNLGRMRADGVLEKSRRLCRERKMLLTDQTAINKYAKKKKLLPRRYNEQHKNREDTLVRHFALRIKWLPYPHTEGAKPWQEERLHSELGLYDYDDIIESWKRIKRKRRAH